MATRQINRALNKRFTDKELKHYVEIEKNAKPLVELVNEYINYNIERNKPNVNEFNTYNYVPLRAYKDGYVAALNEILELLNE